VAASTVSRYLAGQLNVSPATGARLLQAIRDLGYVPNAQARNLPGGARASPASSCRKSATQRRPDREPAGSPAGPARPGRPGVLWRAEANRYSRGRTGLRLAVRDPLDVRK
jgi:hypothetical protein